MKKLFIILLVLCSRVAIGQTTGYVLKYANGSVDLPVGSVTTSMLATPGVSQSALNDSTGAIRTTINSYATLTGNQAISNKTLATFNYAVDAGSNDTYVISLSPAPASYTTGMIVFFKANTVNTGAASINVNSLGAKTIVKRVNTTLANGDIPALSLCMIIYDGTNFVLLNPVVN